MIDIKMSPPSCDEECTTINAYGFNSQYRNRVLIEEKLAALMIDSYNNPRKNDENGVFFINNFLFAANRSKLSKKFGITTNALNKDFRHHKIRSIDSLPVKSSMHLSDIKGWKIFKHSNNDFTLENILNRNNKFISKWSKNDQPPVKKTPFQQKRIEKIVPSNMDTKEENIMIFNTDEFAMLDFSLQISDSDNSSDFPDLFSSDENIFMFNI